ncbi:MAG: hypothetical protein IJG06_00965, partial [Clostridia bacterium]|nr:hypothetical protein [Clostridia bacterium]
MKKEIKLTRSQMAMYADCLADEKSTMYNTPFLGRIGKSVDTDKLIEAVNKTLAVHEALGAVLGRDNDGDPACIIDEAQTVEVKTVTTEEFEKIKPSLVRPFIIGRDKLSRYEVYKTPDGDYIFYDLHHLIIDGTAHKVLAEDIAKAYNGDELIAEKFDLAAAYENETGQRNSETFEKAKAYFDGILGGIEPDCLPSPDVYGETAEQGYFRKEFEIDAEKFKNLRHSLEISTTSFFTAVIGFLIARYNFSGESVINTTYSARNEQNARTVSCLVRILPFVTQLDGKSSIADFLKEQNGQVMKGRENSIYTLPDAAADYGLAYDINFAYQGRLHEYETAHGLDI